MYHINTQYIQAQPASCDIWNTKDPYSTHLIIQTASAAQNKNTGQVRVLS